MGFMDMDKDKKLDTRVPRLHPTIPICPTAPPKILRALIRVVAALTAPLAMDGAP
jgi:hypothetical protein